MIKRPKKNEYAPAHIGYLGMLPPRGSAASLLRSTWKETLTLFGTLPEEKGDYTYAPGKWTIKQVLIHMIDTERVFAFRILWFMRGDRAPLPGFNQDFWMEYADVSNRTIKDLLKEWKLVREQTLLLLKNCTEAQSKQMGKASNFDVSVRAYFYIIIGHHLHHLATYKSNYAPE
jgi:DinB superfamily